LVQAPVSEIEKLITNQPKNYLDLDDSASRFLKFFVGRLSVKKIDAYGNNQEPK
jgi:hypothetical protein